MGGERTAVPDSEADEDNGHGETGCNEGLFRRKRF
jgi:hypothetical protein